MARRAEGVLQRWADLSRSLCRRRRRSRAAPLADDSLVPRPSRSTTEVIRSKGLEKITVDELVAEITPRGRATVPDEIKADLLQRIRKFLQAT